MVASRRACNMEDIIMKQTQFINLFEDMEFNMRLLSGEFDEAIKEGKMKITSENQSNKKISAPKFKKKLARPARRIDIGNAVLTEAKSIEEVIAPAEEVTEIVLEPVDYLVEVNTIEEVIEAKPVAEPVIDEDFSDEDEEVAPKSKCTDIELAVAVINGSNTELTKEDFDETVWQEANDFYLDEEVDYKEEVSPEGETIMIMSEERLATYMTNRANTVSSWSNNTEEVAPISEPVLETKSRLDTLLDIIIENQEEFCDRYNRHYTEDESHKKCPNCYGLKSQGLTADDLTDKALARALYMNIRRDSLDIRDNRVLMPGQSQNLRCIYYDKHIGNELFTKDDLLDVLIDKFNKVGRVKYYADFCGIKDDIRALNRAIA
jgi:hypothetical protein